MMKEQGIYSGGRSQGGKERCRIARDRDVEGLVHLSGP